MRLFFIGDIFGEAGRRAVLKLLPEFRMQEKIDFVVANGENATHGKGISVAHAQSLLDSGVDVLTSGNHAFDINALFPLYRSEPRLLRPANYSPKSPGRGWVIREILGGLRLAVVNLVGRVHMEGADCPFAAIDRILAQELVGVDVIFVDMHAEATSESRAMGWHLDGRVAAVLGSHSHVPTADEEILPRGTAYQTDVGMTGPYRSVIGMQIEAVLERFRTGVRSQWHPATEDVRLCGAVVDIEESTGRAERIERIQIKLANHQ